MRRRIHGFDVQVADFAVAHLVHHALVIVHPDTVFQVGLSERGEEARSRDGFVFSRNSSLRPGSTLRQLPVILFRLELLAVYREH